MVSDSSELAAGEALGRLQLLLDTSRILGAAVDDLTPALLDLVNSCVPDFCDLCAIEMVDANGAPETIAYRYSAVSRLTPPPVWTPAGRTFALTRKAMLGYPGADEDAAVRDVREMIGAESLVISPITAAGVSLGWLYCANGTGRRGLRPSALLIVEEISRQVGIAAQRVLLHGQAVRAAAEQVRIGRQLRRLAAAAANLAGAETAETVLQVACVEACLIVDADGAMAAWRSQGDILAASTAGAIEGSDSVLQTAMEGRVVRRNGWLAFPLPCSDPSQVAALAVQGHLSDAAESVLGSFSALVPVAFERALGTDAIRQHQDQLQTVLDASPVALVTAAVDGTVLDANEAAAELFGWRADERNREFPPAIAPVMRKVIVDAAADGRVDNVSVASETTDAAVAARLLHNEDSRAAVILAATDLREQRSAQRALLQAQRLEAMGQVAGGLAHDFNNLLTVIIGSVASLQSGRLEDHREALLDGIERAATRGANLTQRLLTFTHRPLNEVVGTDMAAAVRDLELVMPQVAGPDVRVDVDIAASSIPVAVQASEMEQIVFNLAINARDALDGRGHLSIEVSTVELEGTGAGRRALAPGTYGRLSVSDDGPGMDEETRAKCLEPFFTTKALGKGSGLGLSTVYGVVSQRRGHLRIDSAPGNGTTVTVLLPTSGASSQLVVGPAADADGSIQPGTSVLLVEDDPDLRALATEALRNAGADVVAAATGEEGLSVAAELPSVDIVVTDAVMPGISGLELVDRLRATRPTLPALLVSGYAARLSARAPLDAAEFLRKPYRPEELVRRVAFLLRPQG